MRSLLRSSIFASLALLTSTAALTARAQVDEQVSDEVGAESLDTTRPPIALRQYNRWVCYAYGHGLFEQRFEGDSQWFAAGSGQGQAAHRTAYYNALTQCRRHRPTRGCTSDFTRDCSVQRRYLPLVEANPNLDVEAATEN